MRRSRKFEHQILPGVAAFAHRLAAGDPGALALIKSDRTGVGGHDVEPQGVDLALPGAPTKFGKKGLANSSQTIVGQKVEGGEPIVADVGEADNFAGQVFRHQKVVTGVQRTLPPRAHRFEIAADGAFAENRRVSLEIRLDVSAGDRQDLVRTRRADDDAHRRCNRAAKLELSQRLPPMAWTSA